MPRNPHERVLCTISGDALRMIRSALDAAGCRAEQHARDMPEKSRPWLAKQAAAYRALAGEAQAVFDGQAEHIGEGCVAARLGSFDADKAELARREGRES